MCQIRENWAHVWTHRIHIPAAVNPFAHWNPGTAKIRFPWNLPIASSSPWYRPPQNRLAYTRFHHPQNRSASSSAWSRWPSPSPPLHAASPEIRLTTEFEVARRRSTRSENQSLLPRSTASTTLPSSHLTPTLSDWRRCQPLTRHRQDQSHRRPLALPCQEQCRCTSSQPSPWRSKVTSPISCQEFHFSYTDSLVSILL